MKKLFLNLPVVVLFIFLAGCQKQIASSSKTDKVEVATKPPHVYKDTTTATVAKVVSNSSGTIKTLASNKDCHLDITYLGNGNYDINPHIDISDYGDFGYTIRNSSNGVVYTYFHNHNNVIETVGGLAPGVYSIEITVQHRPYPIDGDNGTYRTRTFTIVAQPTIPTGMSACYRYFNIFSGQHLVTSDWEELASESHGFVYERVVGLMYPTSNAVPGLKGVYRYYNPNNGDHLTTGNLGTYQDYNYESTIGYVGINQTSNLTVGMQKWLLQIPYRFICAPNDPPLDNRYQLETTIGYMQQY